MTFKRSIGRLVAQLVLLACGSGVVLAIGEGFYACTVVLALLAVWIAAEAVWSVDRISEPIPTPSQTPRFDELQGGLFNSVLDQIPAAILLLEPEGVLRVRNRAARLLLETDDRVVDDAQELLQVFGAPKGSARRAMCLGRSREPRTYLTSVISIPSPNGERRLALLLDIQAEVRAAEAAALRDLMQVLSHEVMNAVTPVASLAITAADLLNEGTAQSTALARDALETVARRAAGLTRFVEAYRALSRMPAPTLRPTSVSALLDETAQLFKGRWAAQDVALELTKPTPDVVAHLDVDLMVHALLNMLTNAAEAALSGGGERPMVSLSSQPDDDGFVFAISDNGPGVRAGDREKIFQPFFTTKATGTGVGLSFARQVALGHGGELALMSNPAREGATFEMRL